MLINVQGVVRLATDIEVRYMKDGKPVANFSVVSSEKYKALNGEQKENACFIQVTVWGRLSEICNQYLRKGSKIFISGKLKQDSWTTEDGSKKSKHSIALDAMEMLDTKNGGQTGGQPQQGYQQATPQNNMDDSNRHNINPANRPPQHQDPYYKQQQSQQKEV